MTKSRGWKLLISWALVLSVATTARAESPSPLPTAPTPVASPTATAPTATRTTARPTATPPDSPRPTITKIALEATAPDSDGGVAESAGIATAVAPRAPRAFRTPERPAPQVFTAPDGTAPEAEAPDDMPAPAAPAAPAPARGGTSLVVFRATARTAIEGFDVRVSYPRTLGTFATDGQQADCNAGTGTLVVASDRGSGELRLLVAAAQALPLPLDVFCRFQVTGGGGLDARQFAVRVAEVTSDAKRADSSLLIVNVVVR